MTLLNRVLSVRQTSNTRMSSVICALHQLMAHMSMPSSLVSLWLRVFFLLQAHLLRPSRWPAQCFLSQVKIHMVRLLQPLCLALRPSAAIPLEALCYGADACQPAAMKSTVQSHPQTPPDCSSEWQEQRPICSRCAANLKRCRLC